MAAITKDTGRDRAGALQPTSPIAGPLKGGVIIPQGAVIDRDASGYLTNGATNTTAQTMGVAAKRYDTTGLSDGAVNGEADLGVFRFANTDSFTIADVGKTAYLVDNNTVARTDGSGARHAAGKVYAVDAEGVWILFNPLA